MLQQNSSEVDKELCSSITYLTAIVEQGRLRPTVPVELPEGATVDVMVLSAEYAPSGQSAAQILAAIAAIPSTPVPSDTSLRHDDVLYSREAHP